MDERARQQWVSKHILPLEGETRGWLRRHVRSMPPADVEDMLQDAYTHLWSANLEAIQRPRAYWFATVRNLVLERARRSRIVPMERLGEIDALSIPSTEPGPERRASSREELDRLLRLVAKLPRQCRQVFELRKFKGLSQREVAARLGIAEKTVENHLALAVTRLLREIAEDDGRSNARDAPADAANDRTRLNDPD